MKKHLIFIISVFLFSSCANDVELNKNTETFSKFPKVEKVKFKKLIEYKYGSTYNMALFDSILVIQNTPSNLPCFTNYNIKSNTFTNDYISVGGGPNEVFSSSTFGVVDNKFWMYDVTGGKILTANKDSLWRGDFPKMNIYHLKGSYGMISLIKGGKYLASTNYLATSPIKFQEFDLNNKDYCVNYGEYILPNKKIPLGALQEAYYAFLLPNPSGDKVVLAYRNIDAIEIFDLKSKKSKLVRGPLQKKLKMNFYKRGSGFGYTISKDDINSCIGIAVTDSYIYLVFSGRLRSIGMHPDLDKCSFYGKSIHVYDWDGNPIKKIEVNRNIMALAVSNDNKTIYSYDPDNGYILKASINK